MIAFTSAMGITALVSLSMAILMLIYIIADILKDNDKDKKG